jgi:taurine dioxygenase
MAQTTLSKRRNQLRGELRMPIDVTPLSDVFAAEVTGADLNNWDDDEQFACICKAFLDHGVIAIRDQRIDPTAQISFARRFGELQGHVLSKFCLPDHPEVLVLSNLRKNGEPVGIADAGRHWHSDMSYSEQPPLGSMLYAHEIPPEGGDTLFADMHTVLDALPPETRSRIDRLQGVYNYTRDYEKARAKNPDRPPLSEEQLETLGEVTHPVVRTHPDTGRKALYINEGHTIGLAGLPETEAQALMEELFAFSIRPEFVYRHVWRRHDVLFWDNRRALHNALPYNVQYTRHMHRVTVAGDRPF